VEARICDYAVGPVKLKTSSKPSTRQFSNEDIPDELLRYAPRRVLNNPKCGPWSFNTKMTVFLFLLVIPSLLVYAASLILLDRMHMTAMEIVISALQTFGAELLVFLILAYEPMRIRSLCINGIPTQGKVVAIKKEPSWSWCEATPFRKVIFKYKDSYGQTCKSSMLISEKLAGQIHVNDRVTILFSEHKVEDTTIYGFGEFIVD